MTVDASTLAPSIDAISEAIDACCAATLLQNNTFNMQLGQGIADAGTAIGDAWTACCNAQVDATIVTIPPSSTTLADGTVINNPGFTGPYWAYIAQQQSSATNNQTNTWGALYQQYLDDVEQWQQNQILPVVLAIAANLAQVLNNLELYGEMLDCTNDLLDCVKEEVGALKGLSIDHLIPAVQQHCDLMQNKFASSAALTAICDQREEIIARSDTMWDCFESTFKPELTQYFADFQGEMFSHGAAGSEQQIELRDLNRLMFECFETYIKKEDELTSNILGPAIQNLLGKHDDACNFLIACSEKLEDHWDTGYAQKDIDYACAAMESATEMLNGSTEVRTFLQGCRDTLKAIHADVYFTKETQHIPELQQCAIDSLDKFKEIIDCAFDCSEDEKARYVAAYEAKEAALSELAMQEACDLHPCFSEIKDWLVEHSDTMQNHWGLWEQKELDYICTIIDKGLEIMCRVEEELEDFCENVECFKTHWQTCYEQAECAVMPKIIMSAEAACEKQQTTYTQICDYMDHLWDKFEQTWCPWDVQDAQYFCDFWMKANPLNELCSNHECQQDLADLLKNCYEDIVLPWEKAYIQEICQMDKYTAKYCENETAASLHIRSQFQKEAERARKGTPAHCTGASKQQLLNIHNQRIRAEAAAMATANRDERWWETQECDRRHRYVMDVLERLGKRFPDHALQFYAGSTEIMDTILGRMHERLLRGYEYVRNTNDYSRTVLNANQAAVEAAQRAVQLGQFYPDLYVRGKSEYFRHSTNYMDDVQDTIRLGQFYPNLASQDQERALNSIDRSANWGFQHMQHGIRHVQTALDAKKVAADTTQATQQNALQSYAIGQDYLRLALAAAQEDNSLTSVTTSAASNAQQVGLNYAKTSADKMDSILRASLEAMRQGNQLMSNTRLYAGQLQSGYDSVVKNGITAFDEFLRSHQLGLSYVQTSQRNDQVSLQAAINNMQETCRFLSANHCCTAQVAAQSNGGALNTVTGLLSGASGAITGGIDGAIGSLASLNTPPSPPSAPFGNNFNGNLGGDLGNGLP